MKHLSNILIVFSIICYAVGIFWITQRNNPENLAFNNYQAPTPAPIIRKSLPTAINIKAVQIDLPIIPSRIINNTWEVSTTGASYLLSSPIPGEIGNSILYSHNWLKLFGNLVLIKPGDEITITYADNSRKIFVVDHTSIVTPTQKEILSSSGDRRLTLYTCTGFLDSQRFVAVAILKDKISDLPSKN